MPKVKNPKADQIIPPHRSHSILSDIRHYFIHKPLIPTFVNFHPDGEREIFTQRIMQRISIDVNDYVVLNVHKIGIDAPARYVFEELLKWDGDPVCWPNHVATVELVNQKLDQINIFLLGKKNSFFGLKSLFGYHFVPLFQMEAERIQTSPAISEVDNARYILYRCRGGYPIGIFAVYVRSSIAEQGEEQKTQFFLVVAFNFYGKKNWSNMNPINKIWEKIHNRVTSNVMNRLKQLCEWRFQQVRTDIDISSSEKNSA